MTNFQKKKMMILLYLMKYFMLIKKIKGKLKSKEKRE
jgi:hypothetical protein